MEPFPVSLGTKDLYLPYIKVGFLFIMRLTDVKILLEVNKMGRKRKVKAPKKDELNIETIGVVWIAIGLFSMTSLWIESMGIVGAGVKKLLTIIAGDGAVLIPILLLVWGAEIIRRKEKNHFTKQNTALMVLVCCLLVLFHLQLNTEHWIKEGYQGEGGGMLGGVFTWFLTKLFATAGTYFMIALIAGIALMVLTNTSLGELVSKISEKLRLGFQQLGMSLAKSKKTKKVVKDKNIEKSNISEQKSKKSEQKSGVVHQELLQKGKKDEIAEPLINSAQLRCMEESVSVSDEIIKENQSQADTFCPAPTLLKDETYHLPPITLLNKTKDLGGGQTELELRGKAKILEETLNSFGIHASVTEIFEGPAITRYEVQPPQGVKVSKIVHLADDIALSMAARDVRIEAPVPGKSVVGIEIPNAEVAAVNMREILEAIGNLKKPEALNVVLGKDISGNPVVTDLIKAPHLLIAGATGSGKSVCINTLITSLLYQCAPHEVKLLMVDPKMVELTNYNGIPHLIAPVVTDPRKAASALQWIVKEMENRYHLFAGAGVRDIKSYNALQLEETEEDHVVSTLPYIVVIIDELADLMMVAQGDVEDAICRLTQMARAAGIHLVVATQRPSVDVITGVIKSNIPSRISFAVSSQVDSRTILDMSGAEKLLGKGDMLFLPIGAAKPIRIQGAYISDKEVEKLINFVKLQKKPDYQQDIFAVMDESASTYTEMDPLFQEAVQIVLQRGQASVSLLQRRLKVGYNRALRLMEQMEENGIVGPHEGSKPRQVLITEEYLENLSD